MSYFLATLNASLNGAAFILLLFGWRAIKAKKVGIHKKCMGSAFGLSVLFLISYLVRIGIFGINRYQGEGWDRVLYLSVLFTHVLLAATVPFLAGRTLYLALKQRFEAHKKIARVTLPIWLYVSMTGVIIYVMLYQL